MGGYSGIDQCVYLSTVLNSIYIERRVLVMFTDNEPKKRGSTFLNTDMFKHTHTVTCLSVIFVIGRILAPYGGFLCQR